MTLKKDVRMRLYPGQADMFPGPTSPAENKPKPTPAAGKPEDNLPVDITCDGAFQFDVTRFVAIFHKKVDVLRTNADGPSDQLNCEVLSLFFEPAGSTGGPPAAGGVAVALAISNRVASRPKETRSSFALHRAASKPVARGWNMT